MAEPSALTPEQNAELERLQKIYLAASARASAAVLAEGMSSRAFHLAYHEADEVVRCAKEILGTTGKHWTAI